MLFLMVSVLQVYKNMNLMEIVGSHQYATNKIFAKNNIKATIVKVTRGPRLISYDIRLDKATDLAKSLGFNEEIALATSSSNVISRRVNGLVRYEISLPPKFWNHISYKDCKEPLQIAIGTGNEPHILAEDSAILVAGVQGSGKSEAIKTMITALLKNNEPEEIRVALIDTHKSIDGFENSAHFICNPISEANEIIAILDYFTEELNKRKQMGEVAVRKAKLPQYILVIDECADPNVLGFYKFINVENQATVLNLIKEGRKFNIKIILGTQKPNEDNMPGIFSLLYARYVGLTSNAAMSNLLTSQAGLFAHHLTGKGDFYFVDKGGKSERIFMALTSDSDCNFPRSKDMQKLEVKRSKSFNGYDLAQQLLYGIEKGNNKALVSEYKTVIDDFNKWLDENSFTIAEKEI